MTHELIAKLESASEGSREIDRDLAKLIDLAEWDKCANWASMPCGAPPEIIDRDALRWLPNYTESIDAALALAERVLPGTTFRIDLDGVSRVWAFDKETFWNIHATINSRPKEWSAHAQANTPALAICAALLRASAAEGAGHE